MNRSMAKYIKCPIHKMVREACIERMDLTGLVTFKDIMKRCAFETLDEKAIWWDYIRDDLEKAFGPVTAVNRRVNDKNAEEDIKNDPAVFLSGPYRPAVGYVCAKYLGGRLTVAAVERQHNVAKGLRTSTVNKVVELQRQGVLEAPDPILALPKKNQS